MQVFISYKREDESFAKEIHGWLIQEGYSPWLDVIDIKPATDWDTSIHNGLRNSEAVIGVISPESLKSRNVLDEWGYALATDKSLILLWLKDIDEADIPPRYGRIQRIDFRKNNASGYERLKQSLLDLGQHQELRYMLLSHDDVSHASAKRYRAEVLTEYKYSKAELREIIKQVTNQLRQSRYYKSSIGEQRYGDRDADAVFLFIYVDLRDKQNTNWICRTLWLTPNYPSAVKPVSGNYDEILDGIEIDWNSKYEDMKKFWSEQIGTKEEWVAKLVAILPHIQNLIEEAESYLERYDSGQISNDELEEQMGRMEVLALDVHGQAGSQKLPPPDCSTCDQEFQNMVANFHNIFVPFATWGQAERNWESKLWLMRDYLRRYYENKQSFEHEWQKFRK